MKGICQFTCDGAFESQVLELVVFYTGATEGCFLLHKMTHYMHEHACNWSQSGSLLRYFPQTALQWGPVVGQALNVCG